MSAELRKSTRIYPKDLADYSVHLKILGDIISGTLGNISQGGLCAIMPESFHLENGLSVEGFLKDNPFQETMPFQGKVAWETEIMLKKIKRKMVGIQFTGSVDFPERLDAISLTLENEG